MHILHVDDNPADVFLCRTVLQYLGFSVEISVATDGEEALQLIHGTSPARSGSPIDLILLDLNLPRKTGFEVLAELQQDPERQFIPVVVFSSTANPEEVNRCYELGANAFMVKPFSLEAYVQKIQATVLFWQACQFRTLPP
jgi:two-component system, chemotaxis family, response regulator Rcp1